MAKYASNTNPKDIIEIGNPGLNPQLTAGRTLVSDTGQSLVNPNAAPGTGLAITSGDLEAPTTPTIPTTSNTTNYGAINSSVPTPSIDSIVAGASAPTTADTELQRTLNEIATSVGGEKSLATRQAEAENAANVSGLLKTQRSLVAQLQGLSDQATQLQLDYNYTIPNKMQERATGRGITAAGLQPLTAGELRKNQIAQGALASQSLTLKSAFYAANNDYMNAKDAADKAAQVLFDADEQYIKGLKAQVDALAPTLNREEKARAATLNAQLNERQANIDNQREDFKVGQGYAIAAMKLNPSDPAAQYAAQQALKLDPKSPTYLQDVINLVGKYQADPNAAQKAIDEHLLAQAQISKYSADAQAALAADAAVNPDVLQGMINVYKSTGVLPAFGLSAKSPLRAQFYAALGADGSIVTDANTNKTVRAGLTTAYKTQQNQYSANQTSIATLGKQLDLAKQYSDKVNRSGAPIVNKYLLAVKQNYFGDPDTAALHNIVTTASYELAKILSGSSASIAGVTVSSAADAQNLLNSAMSKGQFNEVLGLMQQEADFRLQSQKDTLNQLQNDLNNVGSLSSSLKEATSTTSGSVYKGFPLPY